MGEGIGFAATDLCVPFLYVGVRSDGYIDAANDAAAAYDLQEYFTMVREGQLLLPPPMEPKAEVEPSTVASTSTPACVPTKE